MANIRKWGTEVGLKFVWWTVTATATYAWYHPYQTLSSIFLIDRFGWPGARFVGRSGWVLAKSQLRLGLDISKIALQELGPALKPENLMKPFQRIAPRATASAGRLLAASRVAGPPALGLGVAYLIIEGPTMHMELASDPYSGAYILNEDETEIVGTPYLDGPTGTGFL